MKGWTTTTIISTRITRTALVETSIEEGVMYIDMGLWGFRPDPP